MQDFPIQLTHQVSLAFTLRWAIYPRSVPFFPHRCHYAQMDTFAHAANIDLEGYPGVRRTTSSASYNEDHKPVQVV